MKEDDIMSSALAHTIEVVARSTASVSLFSSILIIYVILLSRIGLSNPYHRILFGMSVFDIIGSTAIALTTLPMSTHYENEENAPWTGKRIGNAQTCTAQGFFVYLLAGSIGYNSMLSLYYFFIIGLQKEFRVKLEVALHVLVLTTTLIVALTPVILNSHRPNHELPWCAPGRPEGFNFNQIKSFLLVAMVISAMCFVTSVFSLIFVSFKVFKRNRQLSKLIQEQQEQNMHDHQDGLKNKLKKLRRDTNVVLIQCSCYVLALSLTVAACIIPTQVTVDNKRGYYSLVVVALLPLQGFFDCLIFIGGKVVALRNADSSLAILGALHHLFFRRSVEPVSFSNLSMVGEDIANREIENILQNMNDNEYNCVQRVGRAGRKEVEDGVPTVVTNNNVEEDSRTIILPPPLFYTTSEKTTSGNIASSTHNGRFSNMIAGSGVVARSPAVINKEIDGDDQSLNGFSGFSDDMNNSVEDLSLFDIKKGDTSC